MGFFGFSSNDNRKKKRDPFDDLNITDTEREMIALGKLAPSIDAIKKYRAGKNMMDTNASISAGRKDINKTKGLGFDEDRLMQIQRQLIERNRKIRNNGIFGLFK